MTHLLLSRGILAQDFILEHMKNLIKPHHKALILALSYFDAQFRDHQAYLEFYQPGGEYHEKMVGSFSPYGLDPSQIMWLLQDVDDKASALRKIEQADIIYAPGGAPDRLMARIEALGIKDALKSKQALWIGSSAGAMIQFETYHISPDRDYRSFGIHRGLGLLNGFFIEVHYRRRRKQKSSMRKIYRIYHRPIYIIPDDGALLITDDSINPIHTSRQYYKNEGVIR